MTEGSAHKDAANATSRRSFLYRATRDIIGVTAFSGLFTLPGCGSGHAAKSKGTGTVSVAIAWPTKTTRFIPLAANSVTVTVKEAGTNVATQSTTVARPKTAVIMTDVPTGTLTVTAEAFASGDGTGTALATGTSESFVLHSGETTSPKTLTMSTTVTKVTVTSSEPSIRRGKTCTVTAVAKDASGNTVLVAPSVWTWASGKTSVATVKGSGTDNTATVTGVSAGTVKIAAVNGEASGTTVSGECSVTVAAASSGYRIGWLNSHDTTPTLYTSDIDGQNIDATAMANDYLDWCGDGKHYAWGQYDNDSNYKYYICSTGSADLGLTVSEFYPGKSADATRTVWLQYSGTRRSVMTAPVTWSGSKGTQGDATQVSPAALDCYGPNISADGTKIAFLGRITDSANWRVYTVDSDGGNLVDVSGDGSLAGSGAGGWSAYRPAVSHDGSWVAWETVSLKNIACAPTAGGTVSTWPGQHHGGDNLYFLGNTTKVLWNYSNGTTVDNRSIYMCDPDGSHQVTLTSEVAGTQSYIEFPFFSSDGDYIVYVQYSSSTSTNAAGIRLQEIKTGKITQITSNRYDHNPVLIEQ